MNKLDQLSHAKSLLTSALSAALQSMPNNKSVQEARMHMRKAINELDNAAKTQAKRRSVNEDQFKTWWGNVTSGVANSGIAATSNQPMTQQAQLRSLDKLNSMIAEEHNKIEELEKQSESKPSPFDFLNE